MKVVTIGGGPAGLYFALLLKKHDASHQVTVLERNGPDDAFGWGVVFSEQTLENLRTADGDSYRAITERFARWDDIDVHVKGRTITSSGHGFSGIGRRALLEILQRRAAALGVDLRFKVDVRDDTDFPDADVIVAADGVNSTLRRRHARELQPEVDVRSARYIWLGTTRLFEAFTFIFVETEGGVYQAHAYRFDERHSAFIVECDERSWVAAGFDHMDVGASTAACERMFAPWLQGRPLLENTPPHLRDHPWMRFQRVSNARWHHENTVLIGDAAHTAHFSIGSGTKLAMEDAIVLARELDAAQDTVNVSAAFERYEAARRTEALRLQNAARNSMEWFENVRRYIHLEPEQFAYSLLTRSQRVGHENLRLRDGEYLEGLERWFASNAAVVRPDSDTATDTESRSADGIGIGLGTRTIPPMFTPFRLRDMTVPNRIVVAPMDMYCAEDGTPNDFHMMHLGARALGGAGLIITEMTCVGPEARISLGCTGMYSADHVTAWRGITDTVHRWSPARICLQLGHSGSKGSTKRMWEGNEQPLESGQWEVIAPSAVAFREGMQVPREMTRRDMEMVRDQFVRATRMAIDANFDMIELHCAHGYLLSSFLTPVSNQRRDDFGGSLENRLRFPLEVLTAVRAAWPKERPMSVRVSATDWTDDGVTGEEAVLIARALHGAGADIIHVSAGQTTVRAKPVYGRMFQTPFSDRIRNEGRIPTITVGNITEADQVNAIIASGRADLCALARPHLVDPNWTLHAAAQLGYRDQWWPVQYLSGREQLERTIARQKEMDQQGTGTI